MMRFGTRTACAAFGAALAIILSGCGSSSPQAQKPIKGCDIPADWKPKMIAEDVVVEGFRAENAVKDPNTLTELNALFAHGRPGSSPDFQKWYGGNEDNIDITVRGLPMFNWELFFEETEFPHQSDIYPAACSGWTFESYLQKHPNVDKAYVTAALAAAKPTSQ